jgi:hypothetical protein
VVVIAFAVVVPAFDPIAHHLPFVDVDIVVIAPGVAVLETRSHDADVEARPGLDDLAEAIRLPVDVERVLAEIDL